MKKLLLIGLLSGPLFCQTSPLSMKGGFIDFGGAVHTRPTIVVPTVPSLPATGCTAGELAVVTGATLGQQIYENSGTGACVWTQQLNSGGGTPGGSTTQVQYNNAGAFGGITGATTNGTALTLVGPILGTPASVTLTNATGLPIGTGVSGLATGIATFLGTPSSANLRSSLTDETGTGSAFFQGGDIGAATGTSLNVTGALSATGGFSSGSSPPALTAGTGSVMAGAEGTVPSVCAATGVDCLYFDSTQHGPLLSRNNGGYLPLPQAPTSTTSGNLATFNANNGGLLADAGFLATTVVRASAPGAGVAHFAGSTQVVTSSAVVNADITSIDGSTKITGVIPFANLSQPFVTNAKTATYQVLAADFTGCKTIPVASGTFTITLVASGTQPADGQCLRILNYGSGVVTVARSGQNINGAAVDQTLAAGSASAPTGILVISNGTDYFAQPIGASTGGGGANTALSNLASVSINSALQFQTGIDIGSAATPPRNLFFFGGGTFGSHSIEITGTPTGNRVITVPNVTDTLAVLGTAQTFSAATTFSANGAASTPGVLISGAPFTGGSGTTTKPQLLVEKSGSTSTTWNTNGTIVGANTDGTFVGDLLSLKQNNGTRFSVDFGGTVQVFSDVIIVGSGGNASGVFSASTGFWRLRSGGLYCWNSSAADANAAVCDTFLARSAAATVRLGNVDAAAPVAQTLGVQSVVAGTSNTAGANWTLAGSQGTGTGAGGSIIIQVAPAGSTGTSKNTLATALTISSDKTATFASLAGAGNLPVCADSAGKLTLGSNTAGVLSCP